MALKPSLQLRVSQHLALTPQLQQSIRLLQLSALELNQELEQALGDNPLLERDDDPFANASRIASDGAILDGAPAPADVPAAPVNGEAESAAPEGDDGGAGDTGVLDWSSPRGAGGDDDDNGPDAWAAASASLGAFLREQLAVTQASARDRVLVGMLIEALDDDGYLRVSLEELFEMLPVDAGIDPTDLGAALKLLQSFDPPGVAARSAAECLSIQIEHQLRQAADPKACRALLLSKEIVSNHLPLLASRDYGKLRRLFDASDEQLREADALIRGLNPHPGVGFDAAKADYVVPDVLVRRVRNRWVAQLNGDVIPKLRINQDYASIVKRQKSADGSTHWSNRLQEARWLIRNIQQRFDTILRVATAIVERQQAFFTHGAVAMRPLVLREIGDEVGLHESTISRVTTQKFIATPHGVFELKYFFGSHVATEAGGAASSTAIRALIKQLIGAEDAKDPLTDSRIAELLGEQGIVVARRTVAKYREALKIPAVAQRKAL
jgi:RNA polymerase sigma-54 factor